MKKLACTALFVCLLLCGSAYAETDAELVKEFNNADMVLDGEVVDALRVATSSFLANKQLRGVGRSLRSYLVAVKVAESAITVKFVPRTENGVGFQFKGAIETEVILRRSDLKVMSRKLFM